MANPNPKIENLKLGWGKKPRLNNVSVTMRISPNTKESLNVIASQYGCFHGGKPKIAGLLTKIASGELIVVPAPPQITDTEAHTA